MARADRQLRLSTLLAGSALTLAVVAAHLLGWLEVLEGGLYDLRAQRCQAYAPPPTDRLVHVDIDDAALEAAGAWPWPRTLMADMVDEMSAAGAKVIALDVLYAERQDPLWRPAADGRSFAVTDHDANLAAAFRRAGNVLLPASLSFASSRPQTPVMNAAVALLSADLELVPANLTAALSAKGFAADEVLEVADHYFTLRREAARARVDAELPKGNARPTGATPAAATRATAAPAATMPAATRPASRPVAAAADDPDAAVRLALRRKLFPARDPRLNSPEARLADEAYAAVRALRDLDRFARPAVPGVAAYQPRSHLVPVPELVESAATSAFVDYPNLTDGTVRSVPLFVRHRGRLFPQMGLRIACAMLDVDPADLRVTPDAVTIPAGTRADGTPRPELTVPARTVTRTFSSGRTVDFPLLMDIPFFGPRQWWAMYDPARPTAKKQHLSLARVYDLVRTRQKIEENGRRVDEAVSFFLDSGRTEGGYRTLGLSPDRAVAYFAARPPLDDVAARMEITRVALREADASGLAEQFATFGPADWTDELRFQRDEFAKNHANLSDAVRELPALDAQLKQRRAELRLALAGKAALVGWTATASLADQKPTPLHPAAPGVVVHGVIVNALLTGDVWQTLPAWAGVLVAVGLGLLTTAAVALLSPIRSLAAAVGLFAAYGLVNGYLLFDRWNLILNLSTPLLAVGGAWAGGTITRLVIEGRERARITRRFSTWVDPDIVNYFLETRDEKLLTGHRQDTAVVFTDLEGFTKLSEQLGEDVIPLLNDFMGRAVGVIKQHRGVVNKFLGDGILFFFNAPRPNSTYVADAVASVLDLQRMMVGFNEELIARKLPQLRLRAGVTAGSTITGDAGTATRADYTVIGDGVNLAARLESANKFFGTSNLVTEPTAKQAGDRFLFRPVGIIRVVGQQADVMVYETLAWAKDATEAQRTLAALTKRVFEAFAADRPADCLAAVADLEAAAGPSKLTKVYRQQCEPYASGTATGAMPKGIVLAEK